MVIETGKPVRFASSAEGAELGAIRFGGETNSWLGVRYPGGTRYDLGLLELLALPALLAIAPVALVVDVADGTEVASHVFPYPTGEAGILLDLTVAVFVIGIIADRIQREFDTLDTRKLTILRE